MRGRVTNEPYACAHKERKELDKIENNVKVKAEGNKNMDDEMICPLVLFWSFLQDNAFFWESRGYACVSLGA